MRTINTTETTKREDHHAYKQKAFCADGEAGDMPLNTMTKSHLVGDDDQNATAYLHELISLEIFQR